MGLRCYRVSYSPYFNEKGEVTHAVVSSLDITDAKKEEEALEKSEAQFRNILKSMHYGVYTFDTEGRFTYINDVVAKRSGYPREWHLERTLFDLVREQEREMVRKNFEAAVRGEHVQPYEFAYYRPEGDIAWVHISTTAIREGGRITGVLGLLLDVTKRRKSEEALKDSGLNASRGSRDAWCPGAVGQCVAHETTGRVGGELPGLVDRQRGQVGMNDLGAHPVEAADLRHGAHRPDTRS